MADSVRAAANAWRHAEKKHAMIVLGEIDGDKDVARDDSERALNWLRIVADKAAIADESLPADMSPLEWYAHEKTKHLAELVAVPREDVEAAINKLEFMGRSLGSYDERMRCESIAASLRSRLPVEKGGGE